MRPRALMLTLLLVAGFWLITEKSNVSLSRLIQRLNTFASAIQTYRVVWFWT